MSSPATSKTEAEAAENGGLHAQNAPPRWLRRIGMALSAAMGAGLLWLVITHSYVAYLADTDPEASLRIRVTARAQLNLVEQRWIAMRQAGGANTTSQELAPTDGPVASGDRDRLGVLADLALRRFASPIAAPETDALAPRSAAKEELFQMVRDALGREPLSARGLRLLGELSEGHEPRAEVAKLMRMAVRRNLHEPIAVLWLLNDAVAQRAHEDTVKYADILLRTDTRLVPPAVQALAKACEEDGGLQHVLMTLRSNPPWRRAFLSSLPNYVTDARIPLQLLVGLKDSPQPPTSEDLVPYIGMLLRNQLHELAYYTWIQFLPPDQLSRVLAPFNGDFETKPTGLPFDWIIPKSPNANAGIVPLSPPGFGKALRIEFGLGRIEFGGVFQFILLAPGDYTFNARYTASINGRRGLVWSVSCIEGKEIGRSVMMQGTVPNATRITFDFKVPETGCRAQQLRLFHDSRSTSEQFVSGWSNQQDVRIVQKTEQR